MKEDINKLDQMFEKAFAGFEESPPAAVKSNIFNRILLFSTWQIIKKYVGFFVILLIVGGIAYFSGVFSSDTSGQLDSQTKSVEKQKINNITSQKDNTVNTIASANDVATRDYSPSFADPKLNNTEHNAENIPQISANHYINTDHSDKNIQKRQDKQNEKNIGANSKTIQHDNTHTSQINNFSSAINSNSNQQKNNNNFIYSTDNSAGINTEKGILLNNITRISSLNDLDGFISWQAGNVRLEYDERSGKKENKRTPLLWSAGLYFGLSVLQSDVVKTSEPVSDNNFNLQAKMNFPSGFAGLNVRAEKKHFFFDLGMQYAGFSERISSNQLLYNGRQYQDINYLGQNMVIDTNGAYWHYFYLSTTSISKIDSVWTYRIDTNLISLYDTSYLHRYDTLKDPSWINTYAQFEFPLNVGWTKNFGSINIGISTGPIFSLLVGSKGKMPYRITETNELVATKQEFQAFKFGVSWQISAILNYQFNDRMLIELSPYYRHTLLPYKSSTSSASVRINSMGLQLGMRYYF